MNSTSQATSRARPMAFTLVELLVVIAIITLLLTMLTPALESARTQAKLATCGVNLRTVTSAATLYTQDNLGYYPQRNPNYVWDALHIRAVYAGLEFDLRPAFEPYMSLKSFIDPLLGGPALDNASVTADSNLLCSFNIYTDLLRENHHDPAKRDGAEIMERVNQKFESTDSLSQATPKTYRFGVFAGDRDMYRRGSSRWSASSHPDKSTPPLLRPRYYKAITPSKLTYGEWVISSSLSRTVDLNYAYTDNSVRRYDNVTEHDERMAKIMATNIDEYTFPRFEHLPKE